MSKRLVLILVLAVAVGALVAVAMGATGRLGSRLDQQRAAWRDTPVSTSSGSWSTIPGLTFAGNQQICAVNEVSATVSLTLQGAPVLVRVVMANAAVALPMRPGPARFVAGALETSHSYTFVGRASGFEASDLQTVRVQWRSPGGDDVTLTRGDVNLLFQEGTDC